MHNDSTMIHNADRTPERPGEREPSPANGRVARRGSRTPRPGRVSETASNCKVAPLSVRGGARARAQGAWQGPRVAQPRRLAARGGRTAAACGGRTSSGWWHTRTWVLMADSSEGRPAGKACCAKPRFPAAARTPRVARSASGISNHPLTRIVTSLSSLLAVCRARSHDWALAT